jgi:hypothetical protein
MPDLVVKFKDTKPVIELSDKQVRDLVRLYDSDTWQLHWQMQQAAKDFELDSKMIDERTTETYQLWRLQGHCQFIRWTEDRIKKLRATLKQHDTEKAMEESS